MAKSILAIAFCWLLYHKAAEGIRLCLKHFHVIGKINFYNALGSTFSCFDGYTRYLAIDPLKVDGWTRQGKQN